MIKSAYLAVIGCFLLSGVAHAADLSAGIGVDASMSDGHDARDDKGRPPPRGTRPPPPAGMMDGNEAPGGYGHGPGAHEPGDGPPPPPPVDGHGGPMGEAKDVHPEGGH